MPKDINNNNFCIQPWLHLASWNDGSVPLCCVAQPEKGINLNEQSIKEIWNSYNFRQARLNFISGKQMPQCSHCWKEELAGVKSHRIVENNMWERNLGTDFIDKLVASTHNDGTLDFNPMTLDLRLGNTCNLQCVMCRPRDSSKWLTDAKKLAIILEDENAKSDWEFKSTSISNTDMFDWFSKLQDNGNLDDFLSNIRHIIFGGGEPLLLKEHQDFITKLVNLGYSKNIKLRYHTNGTILSNQFLELWNNFKEVELLISIDDWGVRNNYIRYPANWKTIESHLDILDNTGDNIFVGILCSIHSMNVYNLPDFAEAFLAKKFKKIGARHDGLFAIGTVNWPRYLSITVLPLSVKKKIQEKWLRSVVAEHPRWKRICLQLEFMLSNNDSNLFGAMMDYINKLDKIRPMKFSDVYREYYKILKKVNNQWH